ncbi:DNA helicase [uncultured Microbacterium sp.]|uniref:DNA helicase n=1 Tax=uncultured Microbacterium sp. TaxID=191216 RepID=UPI0025CD9C7D|nr:DNA helicase [uncultured Microbacterium sp.]
MSLSRKHKKELRKLQKQAAKVWETQQVLVGEAADVARDAGRQLSTYGREYVVPGVQHAYEDKVVPTVDRGRQVVAHVVNDRLIPAAGSVVGSALSVWDAANDTRAKFASGKGIDLSTLKGLDLDKLKKDAKKAGKKYAKKADKYAGRAQRDLASRFSVPEPKKGLGAGGVFAIILGVIAAGGVLYAAWQTLRADDELWVADDPLSAPDA